MLLERYKATVRGTRAYYKYCNIIIYYSYSEDMGKLFGLSAIMHIRRFDLEKKGTTHIIVFLKN